jgi:hypothetical protein
MIKVLSISEVNLNVVSILSISIIMPFFFTETRGRSPTHTWHTHNIWFILLSTFVQRSDSNMHAHYIRTEYSPKLLLHVECNLMC